MYYLPGRLEAIISEETLVACIVSLVCSSVLDESRTIILSLSTICSYFCEVDVCKHRPDWFTTRMKGQLPACALSRYNVLAFDVTVTTEVDISIYQPSWR